LKILTGTLRPLPLPDGVPGELWLFAMPGRLEPMTAFLAAAAHVGAARNVNLATDAEIATGSPD
jgi:hypothetical protein